MNHDSLVLEFLKNNENAYCDDCLSDLLKIYPRQAINQICRKFSSKGLIKRGQGQCHSCLKGKIVNTLEKEKNIDRNKKSDYERIIHKSEVMGQEESSDKQLDDKVNQFEYKIRELIHNTLTRKNKNYWEGIKHLEFQHSVSERINKYLTNHPYENPNEINPLDFCDIFDYLNIIKAYWIEFEPIFRSKATLEKHIANVNDLRNDLKHQRTVQHSTKKIGEGSLDWFERIFQKYNK